MIPFTDAEKEVIARLSVAGGWAHADAAPLKAKMKPYLLRKTSDCCCYCRRSMHQWHGLTIDIEHVLPKAKGKYPQFMFDLRNLSVACKRCNMGIKRQDIGFYLGGGGEADPFQSQYYELIHPNADNIDDHLEFVSLQHNNKLMIKYKVVNGSRKGGYSYAYFKLEKLEVNSFDEAQGLDEVQASSSLPPDFARELEAVLDSIELNA